MMSKKVNKNVVKKTVNPAPAVEPVETIVDKYEVVDIVDDANKQSGFVATEWFDEKGNMREVFKFKLEATIRGKQKPINDMISADTARANELVVQRNKLSDTLMKTQRQLNTIQSEVISLSFKINKAHSTIREVEAETTRAFTSLLRKLADKAERKMADEANSELMALEMKTYGI